ncbi:MAG: hypothetical protein J7L07_03745 [Candidatus Odinarchaeota archaeon]|nr:hypothetical protein [Candidatus Odinarchaeota archaeon]
MVEVHGKCPLCKQMVSVDIPESLVKNRTAYPISILIDELHLYPEPHKHIVYVDSHFMVRGVSYALIPHQKITQFLFLESVDRVAEGIFFEIIDTKNMVVDARLMDGIHYESITEEVLDKIYTMKRYIKKGLITEKVTFHTVSVKSPGLYVSLYLYGDKVGVLVSFDKTSLDTEIMTNILKSYSKDSPETAIKEILLLALKGVGELDPHIISFALDSRVVKEIDFDKLESSVRVIGDDMKRIIEKLKKFDYKGKNIVEISKALKIPLLDIASLFVMLDFFNAVLFDVRLAK